MFFYLVFLPFFLVLHVIIYTKTMLLNFAYFKLDINTIRIFETLCLFYSIWYFQTLSILLYVTILYSFSALYSIPLYDYIKIHLFFLLLVDIWIVSCLGLLQKFPNKHSCPHVLVHTLPESLLAVFLRGTSGSQSMHSFNSTS